MYSMIFFGWLCRFLSLFAYLGIKFSLSSSSFFSFSSPSVFFLFVSGLLCWRDCELLLAIDALIVQPSGIYFLAQKNVVGLVTQYWTDDTGRAACDLSAWTVGARTA